MQFVSEVRVVLHDVPSLTAEALQITWLNTLAVTLGWEQGFEKEQVMVSGMGEVCVCV